jgi:hypothetical protein
VYRAHGITTPPFFVAERAVKGEGEIQHIDENSAEKVPHVVFLRRCAPVRFAEIRNSGFSDLRRNERGRCCGSATVITFSDSGFITNYRFKTNY